MRSCAAVALPVYDRARLEAIGEDLALLEVLLHLLAVNNDTNLLPRGDFAGLNYVQEYSRKLLTERGAFAHDGLAKLEALIMN